MVHSLAHTPGPVGISASVIAFVTFMTRTRLLAVLALVFTAILLAGCATTQVQTPQTATTVPVSEAMIFPPPGGPAMLSVIETNYANAVRQEIRLATNARTPGENKISITRFRDEGGDGNMGELADSDSIDLYAEASAAWPQVSMMVSPFYVQNFYGPFGYAVGGAPTGDTCLFAWQRIAPSLKSSSFMEDGTVVIRLQICDRTQNEQSLLRMMYQMRLRDPVFEPWRASPVIGEAGAPLLPRSIGGGFQNVLDLPEAQPPRMADSTSVQAVSAPAPTPSPQPAPPPTPRAAPEPTGPIVPLPGGGTTGSGSGTSTSTSTSTGSGVVVPPPPDED